MIYVRESASVGEPSMQDKVSSGLRWPAQVSASVPCPALAVLQLGRAFKGHLQCAAGVLLGVGLTSQQVGSELVTHTSGLNAVSESPPAYCMSLRRQGASAVSPIGAEPKKPIRGLTPNGMAQLRQRASGLVEGARPGTTLKRGIRLPLYAGLIPPFNFLYGKWGRSLLDLRLGCPLMNIYQRVNEVRKNVVYVQKDKKVGEGGYLAVTHDAVTSLAREHLIKHGVVIAPSLLKSNVTLTGTTTKSGVPFIRYEATYSFNVVNADEPTDCFQVVIEAHAIDQGDKAPGKALSYAKKYAVLKLLEIESGEEEEERETQRSRGIKPNAGAMDALGKDDKTKVEGVASSVIDCFEAGEPETAFDVIVENNLNSTQKLALWTFLDSVQRSALKKIGEERRAKGQTGGV